MSKLDQIKALGAAKAASRNSSDGGGEQTRYSVQEGASYSKTQANALPSKRSYRSKGEEAPSGPRVESKIEAVGVAPGPSEAKSKGLKIASSPKLKPPSGDGVALTSMAHPPGLIDKMDKAIKSGKLSLKRGRPKITEQRPWEAKGMSRRTWYRRQQKESKT
jgi:hypothetical protein